MLRTSSSNPMSIILSASSRQRYLHIVRPNFFFWSMSCSRPGVATTMWNPRDMADDCSCMLMPPMQSSVRTSGYDERAMTAAISIKPSYV